MSCFVVDTSCDVLYRVANCIFIDVLAVSDSAAPPDVELWLFAVLVRCDATVVDTKSCGAYAFCSTRDADSRRNLIR